MNMPILPQFGNSEQSMNSLEISELCQKRHDNVKRLVENLINQQVIACPQIEVVQKEANNRIYNIEVYVFTGEKGKRDSIIVVAQLCPEFTARLVDRWAELEGKNRELTKMEILQMALESEQQKLVLQQQLELAAPKVQYFDKVVDRSTLLNATQVAQKLGMSAVAMNKLLDDLDVYSRNVKRARVFKQWFIDAGYGELKQTELGFSQPMFTTKGEAWAIEKLVSEGVA